MIILNVDPGGYKPFVILFSNGFFGSFTRLRHSCKVVFPVKISGEKSGELTKDKISPDKGSVIRDTPLYSDINCSIFTCKPKSIVINKSLPGSGFIFFIPFTVPTSLPKAST